MLKMDNISKIYRTESIETHALREFSLCVEEGDFVSVTGPSGSGKTTFLNIAGLLEEASSGTYELDGRNISSLNDRDRSRLRNEKIGFIFQSFNLIPELDVYDNVDVPLRYRGFKAAERKRRIDHVVDMVGLGTRKNHLPSQLSGGQQQRAAVARGADRKPRLADGGERDAAVARNQCRGNDHHHGDPRAESGCAGEKEYSRARRPRE
jgi:putative ABC transport system ATP-binding protein